jgi:hypothetical protein
MATTVTFTREIAPVRNGYRWRLIATFAGDRPATQRIVGRCHTLVDAARRMDSAEATVRRQLAETMPPADIEDALATAPGDGARRDGSEVPE